jgi:acyl phosphate:glycerol-3-phosphate acyltransferase
MESLLEFLHNTNIQLYILAYLLGGIPFGLLLAKKFAGVDIKNEGSRSIGATNVLRVVKEKDPELAKKLGAATIALDALKGALPILIAIFMGIPNDTLWAMAVLAVFGHCFSPYLMFEGGKGVATGIGVCVVLAPIQSIVAIAVWFIAAKTIKISSLSSLLGLLALVAATLMPLYQPFGVGTAMPVVIIAIVVVYKHIPNITRLIKGEEARAV